MKNTTKSLISGLVKVAAIALALVAVIGFAPKADADAASTYVIDPNGSGCDNSCLQQVNSYLGTSNVNTSTDNATQNANGTTGGSQGTSPNCVSNNEQINSSVCGNGGSYLTQDPSGNAYGSDINGSGNGSDSGSYQYVQYPYQTYAYYQNPNLTASAANSYTYVQYPYLFYRYYQDPNLSGTPDSPSASNTYGTEANVSEYPTLTAGTTTGQPSGNYIGQPNTSVLPASGSSLGSFVMTTGH